ncbi:adenosine deaminase [Calycina marina]|uniref:adenosine deaminase n=1 Tax=Calycina marina TaxID=1763456 RepID=A0A9P7ZBH5_9HELO|nr:adenosine deaminase [Calycina marina]
MGDINDVRIGLVKNVAVESFYASREKLIAKEKTHRSDYTFRQALTPVAKEACKIVSQIRDEERRTIWKTEGNPELNQNELFPGMMFNVAKTHMETTKLWQIVRKMPKGTVLHAHIGATVDLEWVINEAIETPGMCIAADIPLTSITALKKCTPLVRYWGLSTTEQPTIWTSDYIVNDLIPLKTCADRFPYGGRAGFKAWMKDRCSITQTESLQHHLGVDEVWIKLSSAFSILSPIIYYQPITQKFVKQLFRTLLDDGVRWIELRAVLYSPFTLFEDNEGRSQPLELSRVLDETITEFMASEEGKEFWGARIIWTSMRHTPSDMIISDMKACMVIKTKYPHLIAGYDVVGPEDAGRTLHDLMPELQWFKEETARQGLDIPFFFHAGECLGDGDSTDNNLFDAILLGSRRIGHAFSLHKHPVLIEMVKGQKILVESCPISNEVLRYTASILSHPLPALLARGVPAALSNDDPALLGQGTSGLTHDFWQALQGWENLGLAGLGSLAQNSVRWGIFEDQTTEEWLQTIEEGSAGTGLRARRVQQWDSEWEDFCAWVVKEYDVSPEKVEV